MVVLSALVHAVGLSASSPYLVRHGVRSATWRAREGSLKLVIAGLLHSPSGAHTASEAASRNGAGGDNGCNTVDVDSKTGKQDGLQRRGSCGEESAEGVFSGDGVERVGEGGSSKARGGTANRRDGVEATVTPRRRREEGGRGSPVVDGDGECEELLDREKLLRDVGSLLTDERPEVGGVGHRREPIDFRTPGEAGVCFFVLSGIKRGHLRPRAFFVRPPSTSVNDSLRVYGIIKTSVFRGMMLLVTALVDIVVWAASCVKWMDGQSLILCHS